MGAGLVRDSDDWNIIKSQLESGLFDISVPKDKVTDVSPNEVQVGDWCSKIVPTLASWDMVFMQY